ncbi:monocarboxylate transporter 6-like [Amphiura filiformis]|uniref:monocarboxylate transporter 6-like n=1 Tax=Amphiura filiformis TaxID=82378 RepID=UPI003B21CE08
MSDVVLSLKRVLRPSAREFLHSQSSAVTAGGSMQSIAITASGSIQSIAVVAGDFLQSTAVTVGPLAGALSKRFTARYTVMVFSCVSAFGLIAGSLVTSIPMIMISFLLTGFSIGAEAIVLGELATYFNNNYSIANSIAQTGLSFGVMVIPLLTQFFIDIYGWRGTMLLLGAINMHFVLSGAVLRPVNIYGNIQNNLNDKDPTCSSATQSEQTASLLSKVTFYLDLPLFNDAGFISMIWYNFGNGYCLTGWLIYLVPYAMDTGFNPYKAASLATFGGVGNLLGNIIFPFAIRRFSINQTLYCSTFVSFVSLALNPLFSTFKSYIGLIVSTAAFGCGRGIAVLCSYQIIKENTEEEKMTNAIMWICVSYSFGAIASGFLSGWIYDKIGSFIVSFFILSGIAITAVVPQLIIDMNLKKNYNTYSLLSSNERPTALQK